MSANRPMVNVDGILDGIGIRGVPLLVTVCMTVILVLDGMDIQVIALAAPTLAAEFGIERSALGPVLAAALLGIAMGGFLIGPFGDRWGRRNALLVSTALFGTSTLLATTSTSIEALAAWRFITGIGLGGALPNATAMMAEFSAPRWRSQAIAAAVVGVPIGGMIGAAIGAEIIPVYGWQSIFVVGGALPLLAVAVMYFILPESPRFLATRPARAPDLARLLNRLVGREQFSGEENFVLSAGGTDTRRTGVRALFSRALARDTLATWLVFATNLLAVYAFFSWTPVVLTALGYELATAVRGSLVFNLAGVVGSIVTAWLIARVGSRWPLAALAVVASLSLFYLSQLSFGAGTPEDLQAARPKLMLGIVVAGWTILAIQIGMYAVAAHVYPTECRSSGVGWAVGIGRLGGILSSLAGGFLLAKGGETFFGGVAIVLILTLVGVLALSRHIPAPARPARETTAAT